MLFKRLNNKLIMKKRLNVLIACEESQAECRAFRALGHNAFSCDIQECIKDGHQEWHIHGDVTPFLQGRTDFQTMDGKRHHVRCWHLIIAHPPCTYLCKMSSVQMRSNPNAIVWTGKGWQYLNIGRYEKLLQARKFFQICLNAKANYVAVENPLPMKISNLPAPSFYACPSWYGVKYTKKTLYWVKNLPPLLPELISSRTKCFVKSSRGKYRSRTFPQLAGAIAKQWSSYILDEIS